MPEHILSLPPVHQLFYSASVLLAKEEEAKKIKALAGR